MNMPNALSFDAKIIIASLAFTKISIKYLLFITKNFLPENYLKAKDCWVCYSCGGNCKCRFCVGIDRNRKKRKPKP
jgi:hypothetical protein